MLAVVGSRRLTSALAPFYNLSREFHCSPACGHIIKLTRLRVVDNSEIGKKAMAEGKPPRCIHVYNKKGVGGIGDKVLVAIKGQKKKGILVGCKQNQKPNVPKFDSNNLVLIDDNGTPLGTRIHVPIPTILRTILKEKTIAKGADYTKLLAIATRSLSCTVFEPISHYSFQSNVQLLKILHAENQNDENLKDEGQEEEEDSEEQEKIRTHEQAMQRFSDIMKFTRAPTIQY